MFDKLKQMLVNLFDPDPDYEGLDELTSIEVGTDIHESEDFIATLNKVTDPWVSATARKPSLSAMAEIPSSSSLRSLEGFHFGADSELPLANQTTTLPRVVALNICLDFL